MRREQLRVGMMVQDGVMRCKILDIVNGEAQLELSGGPHTKMWAKLDDLKTIQGDQDIRSYNARIFEQASLSNGKFSKNEDEINFVSGDGIWFTSDTHFNHGNIIRFCHRPFADTKEMDEVLIKNWNERVKPDDTVFHMGDVAWGGSEVWNNILSQLNGHIHLIVGNHDVKNLRQGYMKYFDSVSFQKQITVEGKSIYLNHYPFLCFGGAYRGEQATWQLFGHVHSQPGSTGLDVQRLVNLFPTQYDVGVDNNDYVPVSFAQVKQIIENQQQSLNLIR